MPNKGKTAATPAAKIVCNYCGKTITKGKTIAQGHGSRCAAMQQKFTPAQLQTHYQKISVPAMPKGYIKVATFKQLVPANVHKVAGLTIAKVVKAIGTDRGANPPVHPVAQPYYLPNRHRIVFGWLGTPAGLQAIATGNFDNAPTPPKPKTV